MPEITELMNTFMQYSCGGRPRPHARQCRLYIVQACQRSTIPCVRRSENRQRTGTPGPAGGEAFDTDAWSRAFIRKLAPQSPENSVRARKGSQPPPESPQTFHITRAFSAFPFNNSRKFSIGRAHV